ncbi:MAG: hypothetical protein ABJK39_04995 [Hyphomicrobiales bacterium]
MRLLQLCAVAAFALLSIKLITLAANGAFDEIAVSAASAQDATEKNADAAKDEKSAEEEEAVPRDVTATLGAEKTSREALVNRLSERRDALENRERDLKLREELLAAAEKRLKAQIKDIEKQKEDDGGPNGKSSKQSAKDLVIIYESMKPKDAAKIFNALSLNVLYGLATSMNPRKMSAVLAEMDVKAAERLTVEMAAQSISKNSTRSKRKLQKIGG